MYSTLVLYVKVDVSHLKAKKVAMFALLTTASLSVVRF